MSINIDQNSVKLAASVIGDDGSTFNQAQKADTNKMIVGQ